jgi:hypothetical protein
MLISLFVYERLNFEHVMNSLTAVEYSWSFLPDVMLVSLIKNARLLFHIKLNASVT